MRSIVVAAMVALLALAGCDREYVLFTGTTGTSIGENGGTASSPGGTASVIVPPGALSEPIVITVVPTNSIPEGNIGQAFEFAPDGAVFDQPVSIALIFDLDSVPDGVSPSGLLVGTVVDGVWQPLPDSIVDTGAQKVTATTTHFSIFGIIADTTPPAITATNPANGATGVSRSASVTAAFSEDMDPATVTPSTFTLTGTVGCPGAVSATVSYNAATRTATLTPSAELCASATYEATVTTGAKDISGNALVAGAVPNPWSFTTGPGSVVVTPNPVTVLLGATRTFTATVTGFGDSIVTWSVDGGAAFGTIDSAGLYTAPSALPTPPLATVRAAKTGSPSTTGTAQALLATIGDISLLQKPGGIALEPGGTGGCTLSADTTCVIVTEPDRNELSRVHLATGVVDAIATGLCSPQGVVIEPGGATALVAEAGVTGCVDKLSRVALTGAPSVTALPTALSSPLGVEFLPGGTGGCPAGNTCALATEGTAGRLSRAIVSGAGTGTTTTIASGLSSPRGVVVESGGTTALVTNWSTGSFPNFCNGCGNLTRVDIGTGTKTILAGGTSISTNLVRDKPWGILIEAGGATALVAVRDAGQLVRVGIGGGCTAVSAPPCSMTTVSSGLSRPTGPAPNGGGAAFVTEAGSSSLRAISSVDLTTGRITTLVKGLRFPYGITVEPTGTTAIIAEMSSGRVTRLDLAANRLLTVTIGLFGPVALAPETGVTTALVTEATGGLLSRVDLLSGSILPLFERLQDPRGLAVLAGGTGGCPGGTTCVLVTENSGTGLLSRLDLSTAGITTVASGLSTPRGVAIEPGGTGGCPGGTTCALVAERGSGELSRIDLGTNGVSVVSSGLTGPTLLVMESGGSTALVVEVGTSLGTGEVSRVTLSTGAVTTVASGLAAPLGIAIEPGGASALVTQSGRNPTPCGFECDNSMDFPDEVTRITLP